MASTSPNGKAVDNLPKLVRQYVKEQIVAGVPLRKIAETCGLSHQTIKRYKDEKIMPHVDTLASLGLPISALKAATPQPQETKQLSRQDLSDSVTACDKANAIGEVQAQIIALRERAKGVLTRVESRADEDFSGREWASVATVAARMMETQGRMTGELQDKATGDVSIQIMMPSAARPTDGRTIDVDVLKALKSVD